MIVSKAAGDGRCGAPPIPASLSLDDCKSHLKRWPRKTWLSCLNAKCSITIMCLIICNKSMHSMTRIFNTSSHPHLSCSLATPMRRSQGWLDHRIQGHKTTWNIMRTETCCLTQARVARCGPLRQRIGGRRGVCAHNTVVTSTAERVRSGELIHSIAGCYSS